MGFNGHFLRSERIVCYLAITKNKKKRSEGRIPKLLCRSFGGLVQNCLRDLSCGLLNLYQRISKRLLVSFP